METHNYGRDFAALRALSVHALPYVGLVGPRRRRDQLIADLMIRASSRPKFVCACGIDLGADSPEQIALAIIAEIQAVFAGSSLQSLRDRTAPIHAVNFEDTGCASRIVMKTVGAIVLAAGGSRDSASPNNFSRIAARAWFGALRKRLWAQGVLL